MDMRFAAKKNAAVQKHRAISCQENMVFFTPRRVVLGLSSPSSRVSTDGRTLTLQPKFRGSIGYQICFAMVLRWPAGSTIN